MLQSFLFPVNFADVPSMYPHKINIKVESAKFSFESTLIIL